MHPLLSNIDTMDMDAGKSMPYDVFISGAGPVGLFLAYQLTSLGHSVYICDKKSGPTLQSRALVMTARTVEVLENKGIAHHILKEASIAPGVQTFINGAKTSTIDMTGDTKYPQATIVSQDKTETILGRLLRQRKVDIHWDTEVRDYMQHDNLVAVVITHEGKEYVIKTRYLVGADGCHSAVRKRGDDWTFKGDALNMRMALADVVLGGPDGDFFQQRLSTFFHTPTQGMCGIIPIGRLTPDGPYYHRVMYNAEVYEKSTQEDELTHGIMQDSVNNANVLSLDEVQRIVNERIAPYKITLHDPTWTSYFRINERLANGFRRKNVFLVGDAAHCHSPMGGQGMNLGLQDADNLAWKLSLVLRGLASDPEKLLDSYSAERIPVAEATLKTTGQMTRMMLSDRWSISLFRSYILPHVLSLSWVKEMGVANFLQLNLRLETSPIFAGHAPGLIEPGTFLRDSRTLRGRILTDEKIDRSTLHALLPFNGKHAVLWVATRPSHAPAPNDALTAAFWRKTAAHSDIIHPVVVESVWHVRECRPPPYAPEATRHFWLEDTADAHDAVTRRVGLTWQDDATPIAMVVVRPDLYVAQSATIRNEHDLDAAFEALSNAYLGRKNP
ncbi:FAD binding domain-domain-containing protein [Syncephalastrum racemosum]|uniref:FAD binding domain-domain-containing protein n=1 Tax=Syncephalastrum racemosum TaxID=13706 RepID=A0A1X2HJY5_SYNRA|nr:FAD binding domain-domain-containing protein [Syncephalastrum racemosum]